MTEAVKPAWFDWTAERIGTVKNIAEANGTARDACEAVGLEPERDHLIYKLARREGFKFTNLGRKRDDNAIFLRLDAATSDELTARARHHNKPRRDLAAQLLSLVLAQGPTFIDNLLDEGV